MMYVKLNSETESSKDGEVNERFLNMSEIDVKRTN